MKDMRWTTLKAKAQEEDRMVLVEAKVVDSTHLELSKPIGAPQGGTVFVSVADSADEERREWLEASARALESVYSETEPDYPSIVANPIARV
jgi:hypothetical protein